MPPRKGRLPLLVPLDLRAWEVHILVFLVLSRLEREGSRRNSQCAGHSRTGLHVKEVRITRAVRRGGVLSCSGCLSPFGFQRRDAIPGQLNEQAARELSDVSLQVRRVAAVLARIPVNHFRGVRIAGGGPRSLWLLPRPFQ